MCQMFASGLIRRAQVRAQARHSAIRRELLKMDEKLDSALAFAGRAE